MADDDDSHGKDSDCHCAQYFFPDTVQAFTYITS